MMKKIPVIAFLCVLFLTNTASAEPKSGHTNWGPWSFDWAIRDKAGLALLDVRYNGTLILYKASLPVIRVRYEPEPGGDICGPYADRIVWDSFPYVGPRARIIDVGPPCGGKKICQFSSTINGVDWLTLGIYARIGKYHLKHEWHLSKDGQIESRVLSKGLSCNADHGHHSYWRFDFDINDAQGDQILSHQGNLSSGNFSINYYRTEQNDVKDPSLNRRWLVRDQNTAKLVWIFPGDHDGALDPYGFSTKDVGLRAYHGAEDQPWPFGASGRLGYLTPPESVDTRDIVFWYVAHLYHQAAGGADHWHGVGPTLKVDIPAPPSTPTPTPTPSPQGTRCSSTQRCCGFRNPDGTCSGQCWPANRDCP
jgi:hypothetical protein